MSDNVIFLPFSNNNLFLDKKASNSHIFNTGSADAKYVNGSESNRALQNFHGTTFY